MGERTRKRKREFKDTAGIMEPGGEGFIYDPIFRIKLGTTPILKNFKVRSYLNFMASLPMKRNPATGYFEFAETPEEITALCKAYFFAAEPGALADSGYDQFRINKARHLLVQPVLNTIQDGSGTNWYPIITTAGYPKIGLFESSLRHGLVWDNQAVLAGATSAGFSGLLSLKKGVYIVVSNACNVTIQVAYPSYPLTTWFDHTTINFAAAGSKAQDIMSCADQIRFKVDADVTITATVCMAG